MNASRIVLWLGLGIWGTGCALGLDLPDGANIACATNAECPAGSTCKLAIGRCVPDGVTDQIPPALVADAAIFVDHVATSLPRSLREGAWLEVQFVVNEDLGALPALEIEATGTYKMVLDLEQSEPTSHRYSFVYQVTGSETGSGFLHLFLIDKFGNAGELLLGQIDFDFAGPALADLLLSIALTPPNAAKTAVVGDDTLTLSGQTDVGATLLGAFLFVSGVPVIDLGAQTTVTGSSVAANLDLAALTTAGGVSLVDGDVLSVQVTLTDRAGNETQGLTQNSLLVDLTPPQSPTLYMEAGTSSNERPITLRLAADGAIQACLTGDIGEAAASCADNSASWVSAPSEPGATWQLGVTLSSGFGAKTISAVFRDRAFNHSESTSFAVNYFDGASPVLSNPTLTLPAGQTAAGPGDLMTIGGTGEANGVVETVRLVYVGNTHPALILPDEIVTLDVLGGFSGSLVLPNLVDGERFQLEVVLAARGLLSVAAASRSGEVLFDSSAPPPPVSNNLRLVETPPGGDLLTQLDDSANTFTLTGNTGAFVDTVKARIYATSDKTVLLAAAAVAGGAMAPLVVSHVTSETYYVVAVDGAGNESSVTPIRAPQFSNILVSPIPVRSGATLAVEFDTSVPLDGLPTLTVARRAGGCSAQGSQHFHCTFTPSSGSDGAAEGLGKAPIRITGVDGLRIAGSPVYAAGTSGTTAITTSFDFSAPTLNTTAVLLSESDPGTQDTVVGLSGAVGDLLGADPSLGTFTVTVEVMASDGTTVLDSLLAGVGGDFASSSIGDNSQPSIWLRLTDQAGNSSQTELFNDIQPPSLASLVVTPMAVHDAQSVAITFAVSDNAHDLRALPSVQTTNAGQVATWSAGTPTTSDHVSHAYTFDFVPASGRDAEVVHTVRVTAVDSKGNTSSLTTSLTLDFTKPASVLSLPGARTRWKGTPGIRGTANDGLSGVSSVEFQLQKVDGATTYWNGSSFGAAATWVTTAGTTVWAYDTAIPYVEGKTYNIQWRAVDLAGNVEGTRGPNSWTHDSAAPQTSITSAPPALTDVLDAGFTFGCDDPPCTYECSLNAGPFASCPASSASTYTGLPTGNHTVQVRATDVAENTDATPASYSWTIQRNWQQADLGAHSGCGIAHDHSLWCWGDNAFGQLGLGTSGAGTERVSPTRVGGALDWQQVSCGDRHCCAIKTTGTLWCWGNNTLGQLGDDTTTARPAPQQEATASATWVQVAAGGVHSCGVRRATNGDRTLWCWGYNNAGQLGLGDYSNAARPTQETSHDTNWDMVAVGGPYGFSYSATCALKTDRRLYCWGDQEFGQLGNNVINGTVNQPNPTQEFTGSTNWLHVGLGARHACATRSDGTLWCWGDSSARQSGNAGGPFVVPTQVVDGANNWVDVAASWYHTCGLRSTGALWCWGSNGNGQFGDAGVGDLQLPKQEALGLTSWSQITAGGDQDWGYATCGVTATGNLLCTGTNDHGMLGLGTLGAVEKTDPSPAATGPWTSLAANNHACGIKVDGTLWCWGANASGQLADGTTSPRFSPFHVADLSGQKWIQIGVGTDHTCGISEHQTTHAKTVWCWGGNGYGQVGNGSFGVDAATPVQESTGATTWASLAVGAQYTCALRSDATLWCWGRNNWGALGLGAPANLREVNPRQETASGQLWAKVACGTGYNGTQTTCAVNTTNDLYCWGYGGSGQLGQGDTAYAYSAVQVPPGGAWVDASVGDNHACGRRTDNTVWCWGENSVAAVGNGSNGPDVLSPAQESTHATNWSGIDVGEETSCGTRSDGTLWCWGYNNNSQAAVGTGVNPVTDPTREATNATDWARGVMSNGRYGCGIKTGGTLWCWGVNGLGQHADGITTYLVPQSVARYE